MVVLCTALVLGVTLGFGLLVRWWIGRAVKCPRHYRLDGKVVLITGGSSGIGKHTAQECLARGADVIIACRNEAKASEVIQELKLQTGSEHIRFIQVNLELLASVRKLSEELRSERRIDILINNAGYLGPRTLTAEGYDKTFVVNYLSHFLLTTNLLRMLGSPAKLEPEPETVQEEPPPFRVINLTSGSHKTAVLNFDDVIIGADADIYNAYGQSKLAMLLFSRELSRTHAPCGVVSVVSVAVHPGAVYTGLQGNWPGAFGHVLRIFARLLFRCPLDGAQTSVYCASVDDSELQRMNGELIVDCKVVASKHCQDTEQDRQRLWGLSMEWCAPTTVSSSAGM